jgi:hypothetical protein
MSDGTPDDDPALDDGKADGSGPTLKGVLAWTAPQDVAFTTDAGAATTLVYLSFELSGAADIGLETAPAAGDDTSLDTVLYVYRPTGDKWGAYLIKNDDGGAAKLSKLSTHLDAGAYRVLIKRRNGHDGQHVSLIGTCSGGCTPPPHGCTPTAPREAMPNVFIGPTVWQSTFASLIDSAQSSLDLQMYQFSVDALADHVIAAHQRGVAVRVILDGNQTVNAGPRGRMVAAGVPLKSAPAQFAYSHAKYLVIDGKTGVIASGNFNDGAVTKERNYAIIDPDLDDIADLQATFDADWGATAPLDLSCTRLVVSPINSGQRILDHINGAKSTLDLELLYVTDADIRNAIIAAKNRGVTVRLMLNDPSFTAATAAQIADFKAQGVPTRSSTAFYLHAKLVVADGVALVGSENMSITSLTKNREVGALVFETAPESAIATQFDTDWNGAQ